MQSDLNTLMSKKLLRLKLQISRLRSLNLPFGSTSRFPCSSKYKVLNYFQLRFAKWAKEKLELAFTVCQQIVLQTSWLEIQSLIMIPSCSWEKKCNNLLHPHSPPLLSLGTHPQTSTHRHRPDPTGALGEAVLNWFSTFKLMVAYCKIRGTFWLCSQRGSTARAKRQERDVQECIFKPSIRLPSPTADTTCRNGACNSMFCYSHLSLGVQECTHRRIQSCTRAKHPSRICIYWL